VARGEDGDQRRRRGGGRGRVDCLLLLVSRGGGEGEKEEEEEGEGRSHMVALGGPSAGSALLRSEKGEREGDLSRSREHGGEKA